VLADTFTVTTAAGTATVLTSDSTTAATLTVKFTSTAADTVTVDFAGLSKPLLATVTPLVDIFGSTTSDSISTTTGANGVDTSTSTGATAVRVHKTNITTIATTANDTAVITGVTNQFNSAVFLVSMDSVTGTRVAGTYTYTAIVTPYNNGAAGTIKSAVVTITIAALAAESIVPSAATSSAIMSSTGGSASDSSLAVVSTASTSAAAVIEIKLRNASGSSSTASAQESVTVTTTAGTVGTVGGTFGRSVVLAYTSTGVAVTDSLTVQVRPDGTAGTATISISTPSVTFSPKTVTFFAAAAKTLTATVAHPVLIVGPNAGAVRATGLDANNIGWAGTAYIVASTAADALIAGSATTPVACAWDAANSRHNCPVTAIAPGTAKLKVIDAATVALATATSNEISVVVSGNAAASVRISFDKTSYAPNERARIYVTPLDSAGKEIGAGGAITNLLASGGITSNAGFSGSSDTLTAVSITTTAASSSTTGAKAGSAMYTVYMPAAGGVVTLTATGGASLPLSGQVAVTASATVTDSAASALAAVTALATTVASLKTLITTLTNLVLKIQKKVKA
jgi:hypothetical protein